MPQVTLGLSMHRPEMTPLVSDHMRRHEAIFLEEPPDAGFEPMLAGRLAVDNYLMQLDVAYPIFSKNMCELLQELKGQGKYCWVFTRFLGKATTRKNCRKTRFSIRFIWPKEMPPKLFWLIIRPSWPDRSMIQLTLLFGLPAWMRLDSICGIHCGPRKLHRWSKNIRLLMLKPG